MPANIHTPKASTQTKKIQYFKFVTGPNPVRILDPIAVDTKVHYINGAYVKCLDDDCPVCAQNRKIYASNPEGYRDDKNYHSYTYRYLVNVLDKGLAKICPNCGMEIKGAGALLCPGCNAPIAGVEAKPLNKVKVLSSGSTLFNNLNAIESSILNDKGEVIGWINYDVTIVVSGTGKSMTKTPLVTDKGEYSAPVLGPEDTLFDLSKSVLALEVAEMEDLMRGVSIKDILTARTLSTSSDFGGEVDARKAIEDMFNSVENK